MEAETKKSYSEKDQDYLWHGMKPYQGNGTPLIAESGKGSWFTDTTGKRYFDGVSGLWCLNLGHGQEEIIEAAANQMKSLAYFPLSFGHKPAIDLAEKLSELLGGGYRSFFLQMVVQMRTKRHLKSHANIISNQVIQKKQRLSLATALTMEILLVRWQLRRKQIEKSSMM